MGFIKIIYLECFEGIYAGIDLSIYGGFDWIELGFAYEIEGVTEFLTSKGVKAIPGEKMSTQELRGRNWVIDDILVFSPDEKSHAKHIQSMLEICQRNGLILKCSGIQNEMRIQDKNIRTR